MKNFPASLPPGEQTLALACGLLGAFELSALLDLLDPTLDAANVRQTLQSWAWIQRVPGAMERYSVTNETGQALQAYLQKEQPAQHTELLRRAVAYFAGQLRTNPVADARLSHETALMRHLDPLLLILADNNQIHELVDYLQQMTALGLQVDHHHQTLLFYQAIATREQHDYKSAKTQLLTLLSHPNLEQRLRARALNALGWVNEFLCQFDQALAAYAESAEIFQQLNDQLGEGKAVKNQGIVYLELGLFRLAESSYQRAYQLARQLGDPVLEMRACLELGYCARQQGQWEIAEQHYQDGLYIAQQQAHPDMLARFANNLGSVACFIGNWKSAEQYHQMALAVFLDPQHLDRHEAADAYHNLGRLALVQGQFATAQHYFEEGLIQARTADALSALCELRFRLGQLWQQQHNHTTAYTHYQRAVDATEEMLQRVSQENTQIQVAGIRQQTYQAMVLCCLQLGREADAFAYVQRAKGRAFLDLVARSGAYAINIHEQPRTVAEIQAYLPANTALIEYFATGETGLAEPFLDQLPPQTQHVRTLLLPAKQLLAFVITPQTLAVVTLDFSLEALPSTYFDSTTHRFRGTEPGDVLSNLSRWQRLDTLLIEPVRPYLQQATQLIFAPHNTLHYLPLHALAKNGHVTANPESAVSYIPSASMLLQIQQARLPNNNKRTILAIGVDGDDLQHAAAEAAWVAKTFVGDLLLNAAATVAAVRSQLAAAQIIHFSGHGHFYPEQPMLSGLRLFDGELTAADILQAGPLQAALVVLSACETGLNQLMPGGELMGFTRALLGAGVKSVLMTLWKVEELPTRIFIEEFYQSWQTGRSRSAAVTAAQQALRAITEQQLRARLTTYGISPTVVQDELARFALRQAGEQPFVHPYYWAGFVLVGDPT